MAKNQALNQVRKEVEAIKKINENELKSNNCGEYEKIARTERIKAYKLVLQIIKEWEE